MTSHRWMRADPDVDKAQRRNAGFNLLAIAIIVLGGVGIMISPWLVPWLLNLFR